MKRNNILNQYSYLLFTCILIVPMLLTMYMRKYIFSPDSSNVIPLRILELLSCGMFIILLIRRSTMVNNQKYFKLFGWLLTILSVILYWVFSGFTVALLRYMIIMMIVANIHDLYYYNK